MPGESANQCPPRPTSTYLIMHFWFKVCAGATNLWDANERPPLLWHWRPIDPRLFHFFPFDVAAIELPHTLETHQRHQRPSRPKTHSRIGVRIRALGPALNLCRALSQIRILSLNYVEIKGNCCYINTFLIRCSGFMFVRGILRRRLVCFYKKKEKYKIKIKIKIKIKKKKKKNRTAWTPTLDLFSMSLH